VEIKTVASTGIGQSLITVDADIRVGLFRFDIVGLADKTIDESKLRILAALRNSGVLTDFKFRHKILVLLTPASVKKEGTHFDLPIALACVFKLKKVTTPASVDKVAIFGELNLKGEVLQIPNLKRLMECAIQSGVAHIIIPKDNMGVFQHTDSGIHVYPVSNIIQAFNIISGNNDLNISDELSKNIKGVALVPQNNKYEHFLLHSYSGNPFPKVALIIALSGLHHVLFTGSPGTGKSVLCKSGIEILQVINPYIPVYEPHHTISYSDIIGSNKKSGYVHAAHNGILLMDELAEFNRRVLEALRQPLEAGYTSAFDQHNQRLDIPAHFQLLSATNLCKCGNFGSTYARCRCISSSVIQYQNRISEALANRIDIHVHMNHHMAVPKTLLSTTMNLPMHTLVENIKGTRLRVLADLESIRGCVGDMDKMDYKKIKALYADQILNTFDEKLKEYFYTTVATHNLTKREEGIVLRVTKTISYITDRETTTEEIDFAITLRKRFLLNGNQSIF
jgi:magnesium chelatase family protein